MNKNIFGEFVFWEPGFPVDYVVFDLWMSYCHSLSEFERIPASNQVRPGISKSMFEI